MRNILFIFTFVAFIATNVSYGCTTAVISGKYTADGRPILWKHRDSGTDDNKLMYFDDGRYSFVGLVNAEDASHQVWSGANETGFSIMNSASYNLRQNDTTKIRDREGIVMRMALQYCASIQDFENLLDTLSKPMGLEANFGVIDANGAAAYYETNDFTYVKFDANDPKVAPLGYIIRTNYSNTGKVNTGYGFIRYQTTSELFYEAAGANNINISFLMNDVSRCLYNSLTDIDLNSNLPIDDIHPEYKNISDCIVRYSSTASIAIKGVKEGENPLLTTMWSMVGNPLSTVVIPVWVNKNLPDILSASNDEHSQLCDWSMTLKHKMFPINRGSGHSYINMSVVANKKNTGIIQKIHSFEKDLFIISESLYSTFLSDDNINNKDLKKFYDDLDKKVQEFYYRDLL